MVLLGGHERVALGAAKRGLLVQSAASQTYAKCSYAKGRGVLIPNQNLRTEEELRARQ